MSASRSRALGRPTKETASELAALTLAAARKIFLRDGFLDASMDAVAAEIGSSKRTIYSRFESKEALLIAVVDADIARLREIEEAATSASGAPLDRLKAACRLLFDYAVKPDILAFRRLLGGEAGRKEVIAQRLVEWRNVAIAPLRYLMEEASDAGHVTRSCAASELAEMLWDLVGGSIERLSLVDQAIRPDTAVAFEQRWKAFEAVARSDLTVRIVTPVRSGGEVATPHP